MRLTFLPLFFLCYGLLVAQSSPFIHVDQFGYQPDMLKYAVMSDPQVGLNASDAYNCGPLLHLVRSSDEELVYNAVCQLWSGGDTHADSGDRGWHFDFSEFEVPGTYYVYDSSTDHRSEDFIISDNVYNEVMRAALRTFYYNRSNIAKPATYTGQAWTDAESFMGQWQDPSCRYIYDQNNASLAKELSGGWFDAGDYNKYVTFADDVIHDLLWAYTEYPEAMQMELNIPESNNQLPDIIDEVIIELDWLMKMNNADGSTHNKMGSTAFGINEDSPPSNNFAPRYYGPTCTSASLAIASMFSHAALVLSQFPELASYVDELESRAIMSWSYALPFAEAGTFETDCDDGSITAGDCDLIAEDQYEMMITAAVYLYALTGDALYQNYLSNNIPSLTTLTENDWNVYDRPLHDALFYYTELNGASASLSQAIVNSFDASVSWNDNGQGFYGEMNVDLYRSEMPDWSYHWGSNMLKAGYGLLNRKAAQMAVGGEPSSAYDKKSEEYIHYFHGVNPLGYTYLSNMGSYGAENSLDNIFHLWFYEGTVWDDVENSLYGPPPGYLSGGPNQYFSLETLSPPAGQPPMKSFLEFNSHEDRSYEVQEPAIYYQAAYIRLLAGAISEYVPCPADFDLSGEVDVNDFLIFNSAFGSSCSNCPEDFDGNGIVDVADFLDFNSYFGEECE